MKNTENPLRISRRDFLRIGSLAAAGILTVGCDAMQEKPLPGKPTATPAGRGGGSGSLPESIATPTTIPATATATSSPTATEVAKKVENILPEYSVFYGRMQQENAAAKGSAIIANIPGYPNQLYAFFEANRSGGGFLYEINRTDGNKIEVKGKINITLKDTETLSGRLEKFSDALPTSWIFELKYYGTGRTAIIEAAKKLWATEIANAPTEWQKVPEETILTVGFRRINLP